MVLRKSIVQQEVKADMAYQQIGFRLDIQMIIAHSANASDWVATSYKMLIDMKFYPH